ncbi:hypothetical protein L1049_017207 [Liquidambar formosana]|uniref:RNase H type-1 domain-containing protein n=1 Tax=Liquidambar formosana TaxID=63359 RepID=A0AAP0X798_LIQFO
MLLPKVNYDATLAKATEFYHISGKCTPPRTTKQVMVKWEPPARGEIKLNIDGLAIDYPGKASAGGLIRDHLGRWVKGFVRKLCIISSVDAELWALRDGLNLALKCNINKLYVDMDASSAIYLINSEASETHLLSTIILDCRLLMTRLQELRIQHAFP